jgi:hypothetical protein
MLFDRIPFVLGSGVVPRRFEAIKRAIADVLINTFFEEAFLSRYVVSKAGQLTAMLDADTLATLLDSPAVNKLLDAKLADLAARPEGVMLGLIGMPTEQLKPVLIPLIISAACDILPQVTEQLNPRAQLFQSGLGYFRREAARLVDSKMRELSADDVTAVLDSVIRHELGALVVWGAVLGGLLGLLTVAADVMIRYRGDA